MLTSGKIIIVSHPPHAALCVHPLRRKDGPAFLHSGKDPGIESGVRGSYHTLRGGGQTTAAAAIHGM